MEHILRHALVAVLCVAPPSLASEAISQPTLSPTPLPEAEGTRPPDVTPDRDLVFPTARTLPAGGVAISSYTVFGLQGTYAIRDGLQVSALGFAMGSGLAAVPSVKWQLSSDARSATAVMGGFGLGIDFKTAWRGAALVAAGIHTRCIDDACRLEINALAMPAVFVSGRGADVLTTAGATLSFQAFRHLKLFAGGHLLFVVPEPQLSLLIPWGLRVHARHFALDLGLVTPLGLIRGGYTPLVLPIGIPVLALSGGW